MEMNTRIQVEHTVTEEAYGCDLVKEQIRIAAGQPLSAHVARVARAEPRLHAIECRINAEDAANNFQATPGRIDFYYAPGGRGVRVDSHVYTGYTVPPYYDSLIAKIITVGSTRINAIDRMRRALDEYYITGIKTTVPFHAAMMRNGDFRDGNYDTGLIDRLVSAGKLNLSTRPLRLHE
jgi:acetyl-CoA carboxylase biotin carboxylase subunit